MNQNMFHCSITDYWILQATVKKTHWDSSIQEYINHATKLTLRNSTFSMKLPCTSKVCFKKRRKKEKKKRNSNFSQTEAETPKHNTTRLDWINEGNQHLAV
jgi:hypothetical protein